MSYEINKLTTQEQNDGSSLYSRTTDRRNARFVTPSSFDGAVNIFSFNRFIGDEINSLVKRLKVSNSIRLKNGMKNK